jgi:hypothetical protein
MAMYRIEYKFWRVRVLTLMLSLTACITVFAESDSVRCPVSNVGDVCMSVESLQAVLKAYERFIHDQPFADLSNFFVAVGDEGDFFEVSFIPRQNPVKVAKGGGGLEVIIMDNPRGNQYGRSVEYEVQKNSLKIIRETHPK